VAGSGPASRQSPGWEIPAGAPVADDSTQLRTAVGQHLRLLHSYWANKSSRPRFQPWTLTWPFGPFSPDSSDINLFRYCKGIIHVNAEIPDRAFYLGVAEQKLYGPQVPRASVNQGSLRSSQ
jgi:hypothetical protein